MKVAQLCLTVCSPRDNTVHAILQARILDWVAFPFSRVFSQPRDRWHVKGGRQKYFLTNKIKILKPNPGNSILNDRIPFVIEVISRKFL